MEEEKKLTFLGVETKIYQKPIQQQLLKLEFFCTENTYIKNLGKTQLFNLFIQQHFAVDLKTFEYVFNNFFLQLINRVLNEVPSGDSNIRKFMHGTKMMITQQHIYCFYFLLVQR